MVVTQEKMKQISPQAKRIPPSKPVADSGAVSTPVLSSDFLSVSGLNSVAHDSHFAYSDNTPVRAGLGAVTCLGNGYYTLVAVLTVPKNLRHRQIWCKPAATSGEFWLQFYPDLLPQVVVGSSYQYRRANNLQPMWTLGFPTYGPNPTNVQLGKVFTVGNPPEWTLCGNPNADAGGVSYPGRGVSFFTKNYNEGGGLPRPKILEFDANISQVALLCNLNFFVGSQTDITWLLACLSTSLPPQFYAKNRFGDSM